METGLGDPWLLLTFIKPKLPDRSVNTHKKYMGTIILDMKYNKRQQKEAPQW